MKRAITNTFLAIFFLTPLILFPYTSEIFEFNKIIFVYIATTIITGLWLARMVVEKKSIFRRTILDIPLLFFLGTQTLATFYSIDPHTSVFGYYSRFNGGLLSTISYILLYWAFVSNISKRNVVKMVYALLVSTIPVSIYAILQRFGIDTHLWSVDSVDRVFSTFGQPNWLAAWLVTLLPVSWTLMNRPSNKNRVLLILINLLALSSIVLTKSRSGMLALVAVLIIFGLLLLRSKIKKPKSTAFLLLIIPFVVAWSLFANQDSFATDTLAVRKLVWSSAVEIWKENPIVGTGVETFAYSFFNHRLPEHNQIEEWDYVYSKVHNEFLGAAANSGTLGLLARLMLVGGILVVLFKASKKNYLSMGLIAGFMGLEITNLFGFLVVPTSVLFFLFPAFAVAVQEKKYIPKRKLEIPNFLQQFSIATIFLATFSILFATALYWYSDTVYLEGKNKNTTAKYQEAIDELEEAVAIQPGNAIFVNELADAYANASLENESPPLIQRAISLSTKAVELSPRNTEILRSRANIFVKLSLVDEKYLNDAESTLAYLLTLAPNHAKYLYNFGLMQARLEKLEGSMETLAKTVKLKPNYEDARIAYAIVLKNYGDTAKARKQLNYILTYLNPANPAAARELAELGF